MIKEILEQLAPLDAQIAALKGSGNEMDAITAHASELAELAVEEDEILRTCGPLTAEDRVFLARHPERPHIDETVSALFTDFFEQRGDRQCKEDPAILGGIARFHGLPVTVIGHRKGSTLEENLACNFGMPGPEGYRKALRLMKQAEKFGRPIITFIDTPGAYPGKDAEERGQGEAIARNLMEMSGLTVPVIAVVTGEGSSGGALALGVANHILMLENAVYSVLSPEGFASILWKDASRSGEACEMMKLTAQDLYSDGIVEQPRIVSGGMVGDSYMRLAAVSELNMHYVSTHFMHPDDLLDPDRGAKEGWGVYKGGLTDYLDWLSKSAPDLRRQTGSECSGAIQRFSSVTVSVDTSADAWTLSLGNFHDEAWLMFRANNGDPGAVTGGEITHLTGDLYLVKATDKTVTIARKEGGDK